MRILYHHRTRGEDAQGVHITALCRAFEGLGHEVRLMGPPLPAGGGRSDSGKRDNATLLGLPLPHWLYEVLALGYNVPAFFALAAAILRWRPDFVYERYALFGVAGRLAAGIFRVPFILEVNAPLSQEMKDHGGLVFQGLARRVEDRLCAGATRTVVVSAAMRDLFVRRGLPEERFLVVPNGVDRERFHPGVDGEAVRRELGLEDRFVIGFVGWIRPWHGVHDLVEAFARVVAQRKDAALLLVGDGPAVPELRARAAELGLADRVVFTGAVAREAVPGHVAAMDVAVQPDVTPYASPIKLFEYLATGRPVVAPDRPNIAEVVGDGRQGLLFRPGNVEELAAQLTRLALDPGLRNALSMRAARAVEEQGFHWEANARRVLAVVDRHAPEAT
ncbi:group 1 glycosyl transferase [Thiohalorhabdus denitrificans]|uniref:Glycosyltransferase involved in cell wall bisynthesis n=1 Tax=Thiohalorhabdus denitrificans TaxID=381306 RepID=A0A0P9CLV0_9GAMM|nr:glycosyltransferase family 4 protein [Thiohalorhabdus denitrificans]KPV40024.1 group 1 glycosyl transferase [Thiohalorhabdus denitrificans]SCY12465.1 Glycosyltransferase involved in cell wall bisynthesis [Thiohalorhabdus denitrificans]